MSRGPWIEQGEWSVDHNGRQRIVRLIEQEGFGIIAGVIDLEGETFPLLLAARDLLAVCEAMIAECEDTFYDMEDMYPEFMQVYLDAKAAIAKAKGGDV